MWKHTECELVEAQTRNNVCVALTGHAESLNIYDDGFVRVSFPFPFIRYHGNRKYIDIDAKRRYFFV